MAIRANRRLICLLTALLLAVSGIAHAYAATSMMMQMSAAPMEGTGAMHDMEGMGGMECPGKNKAARTTCDAMCASAIAIFNEPIAVPAVVATRRVESALATVLSGLGLSPEPRPPKS